MTIQFTARVSKNGIVRVPSKFNLEDSKVKVILEPEPDLQNKNFDFVDFVAKWGGYFSTDTDTDLAKFTYLSDKYR
jgi:hypothetical protein